MSLTHKQIDALSRLGSDKITPDGTPNLYAHARASGNVNWVIRTSVNKKRVPITVGRWPVVTAAQARAVTPAVVGMLKSGFGVQTIRNAIKVTQDPQKLMAVVSGNHVAADRDTPSFESVARDWYDNQLKDGLSEGPYKRQVIQQLRDHVFSALGSRPVNQIRRREIIDAITPLWKTKYPTAIKVRGNIERIFDYAIDRELLEHNPAPPPRSMGRTQHTVNHFKSLQPEDVKAFWTWLQERPRVEPQTKAGISLALLLGKRSGELLQMRWPEIDFERAVWSTPAEHMKKRKAHRQPLPSQVVDILTELHNLTGTYEYVLGKQAGRKMSNNTMLKCLKDYGEITTHGFRATLSSWAAEQKFDERAMMHIKAHQPKYLDAAYQRTDMLEERRLILQTWADYVTG